MPVAKRKHGPWMRNCAACGLRRLCLGELCDMCRRLLQSVPKRQPGSPAEPEPDLPKTDMICMLPGCNLLLKCRGLCRKHYWNAAAQVREGVTTWAELEAKQLSKPRKPRVSADKIGLSRGGP